MLYGVYRRKKKGSESIINWILEIDTLAFKTEHFCKNDNFNLLSLIVFL